MSRKYDEKNEADIPVKVVYGVVSVVRGRDRKEALRQSHQNVIGVKSSKD